MALRNIVYLSVAQYTELKANGSIEVDGQTIVYSTDDVYITPDDTAEQLSVLEAELQSLGGKVDDLQGAVDNLVLEEVYPVGSRYVQFPDEPTPGERLGGTWVLDDKATDKFLVGAGNLYALGDTGGEAEHTLTVDEMPSHKHNGVRYTGSGSDVYAYNASVYPASGKTEFNNSHGIMQATGGGKAHNNLPPYLAVKIWKRTA